MATPPERLGGQLRTTFSGLPSRYTLLIHGMLWTILLVIVAPIILTAVFSTQTTTQVYQITNILPGTNLVENYTAVLFEYNFLQYMTNSLIMTTVVIVGKLSVSLLAATALVYYRFPYQNLVFYFILFTLLMPLPVRVVPLYQLMADIGWLNTFAGLTSPFIASATSVFLFRQRFRSVPTSVVETAKLDGIGPLRFLVYVLIPMSKGMIAGVSAVMFIATWNAYLWPLVVIVERANQVAQVGLRYIQGVGSEGLIEWNLVMTAGVLVLIPPLLVLVVARKYLLSTLASR
jgi:sn-glycerol 3-phosphate transport system permease protein